jgi:hypothetical protein
MDMDSLVKAAMATVVLAVCVFLWRSWQDRQASPHWPSVGGTIEQCEPFAHLQDPHQEGVQAQWRLALRYRYEVAGQTYTGSRLSALPRHYPDEATVLAVCRRYPVGQKVQVFHDPARPERSVLEPG